MRTARALFAALIMSSCAGAQYAIAGALQAGAFTDSAQAPDPQPCSIVVDPVSGMYPSVSESECTQCEARDRAWLASSGISRPAVTAGELCRNLLHNQELATSQEATRKAKEAADEQRRFDAAARAPARAPAQANESEEVQSTGEANARQVNMKSPRITVPAFSMALCLNADARGRVFKEIAEQKRYSKLGGVVDMRSLYDLQDEVRALDHRDGAVRKKLGSSRPLQCKDARVRALVACVGQEAPDSCSSPESQASLSLIGQTQYTKDTSEWMITLYGPIDE